MYEKKKEAEFLEEKFVKGFWGQAGLPPNLMKS